MSLPLTAKLEMIGLNAAVISSDWPAFSKPFAHQAWSSSTKVSHSLRNTPRQNPCSFRQSHILSMDLLSLLLAESLLLVLCLLSFDKIAAFALELVVRVRSSVGSVPEQALRKPIPTMNE